MDVMMLVLRHNCVEILASFLGELLQKLWVIPEGFGHVNPQQLLRRHIRRFLVEATVDVQEVLHNPGSVPKLFDRGQLEPFGSFSVVDVNRQGLADLVVATAHHEHQLAEE